jgi:hypothetical protein
MSKTENLTPAHMRCAVGTCPSLYRLEDGRFLVVGKVAFLAAPMVWNKMKDDKAIGPEEYAIVIDPALLDTYVEEKVAALEERISIARALTYEGHARGATPDTVRACGCVHCRIRDVLDGCKIVPDPRALSLDTYVEEKVREERERIASLAELRSSIKRNDTYYEAAGALEDFAAEIRSLSGSPAPEPESNAARLAREMREGTARFVSATPSTQGDGKSSEQNSHDLYMAVKNSGAPMEVDD